MLTLFLHTAALESSEKRLRAKRGTPWFYPADAPKKRQRWNAGGPPIGSGAIEGTCKNPIKGRLDCVGQRWDVADGIERMAALRVRLFNQCFDDLWPSLKYPEAA